MDKETNPFTILHFSLLLKWQRVYSVESMLKFHNLTIMMPYIFQIPIKSVKIDQLLLGNYYKAKNGNAIQSKMKLPFAEKSRKMPAIIPYLESFYFLRIFDFEVVNYELKINSCIKGSLQLFLVS